MKHASIIILALLVFLQPFSKIWIIVSFEVNRAEIAKTLCVKKDIPKNTCQGKCHLKKQLDKAEEEENKQASANQKEKFEVLFCTNLESLGAPKSNGYIFVSKIKALYQNHCYKSSFITDIFHPPQSILI